MNRLERIPVPVIPTFVGALTLGNVYAGMGYSWIRHITMWAATILIFVYIAKIILFPKTCKKEYETVVPCSLYAGFTMKQEKLMMKMYMEQETCQDSVQFGQLQ